MTQKCLKATELCLSGLPVERECFTWNIFLYVIFLNHVCSEALWPGGSDHCPTPARLWWRVRLLLLNINTAPPASDWGAAKKKKKPFIPVQNQLGQPAAQCISHISGEGVDVFLYFTLVRTRAVSPAPHWPVQFLPERFQNRLPGCPTVNMELLL